MNHHLPQIIYGAVIGHFLMALWRKMLNPAPHLIIVSSKSNNDPVVSLFMDGRYPAPRKLDNGSWIIEQGLVDAMRGEGYLFNPRTGGWYKDPNYVEPPEYEAMPF